jgi:serine/threonine protein kinase
MSENDQLQFDPSVAAFYDMASSPEHLLSTQRYVNEEWIAEGSIKHVYKVFDTYCEREVALAKIKDEVFDFQQTVDFIREVQVTSSFEHPNIIRIYDLGVTKQSPWFTMELTTGKTLADRVTESSLDFHQKIDLMLDICGAIHYAHQRDILHLDIKPENISLGQGGQYLLGDWGIASSVVVREHADFDGEHTLNTHLKGTPGYMAPEQVRGDYIPAPQTDIFGLGCLFYFMLTGSSPIIGDSAQVRLTSTVNNRLKDLDSEQIPPHLRPVIKKCLKPLPSHRYPSAEALAADILLYRDGFATNADTTSFRDLTTLFFKRHKKSTLSALALLLLLAVGLFTYIQQIQQSKNLAEAERVKALELVQQLQNKEDALRSQRISYASDLNLQARILMRQGKIQNAYKTSFAAHQLDPESSEIAARFGSLSFFTKRFVQAQLYLPSNVDKAQIPLLIELNNTQLSFPPQEKAQGILATFKSLCVRARHPHASYFFLYDRNASSVKHAQRVKALIEHDNRISNLNFHWSPKTGTLDLSGNPTLKTLLVKASQFAPSYNMISGLPVTKLILDDNAHNRRFGKSYLPNRDCILEFKRKSD